MSNSMRKEDKKPLADTAERTTSKVETINKPTSINSQEPSIDKTEEGQLVFVGCQGKELMSESGSSLGDVYLSDPETSNSTYKYQPGI